MSISPGETVSGFVARSVQRLLVLSIDIYLKIINERAPLAAYARDEATSTLQPMQ